MVNKLETAFERLRAEGWYCAWGLPCCQSCAWDEVTDEDDIDLEKVLFNHDQDIEEDVDYSSDDEEWEMGMNYCTSDELNNSLFCFSGSAKGVKNLIEVLPIFEECGVKVFWNQKGNSRIELEW
jgi:hypothetical protein